jgi:hypothetical protein
MFLYTVGPVGVGGPSVDWSSEELCQDSFLATFPSSVNEDEMLTRVEPRLPQKPCRLFHSLKPVPVTMADEKSACSSHAQRLKR